VPFSTNLTSDAPSCRLIIRSLRNTPLDLVDIADLVEQYEVMTRVAQAADAEEDFDSIYVVHPVSAS